MLGMQDDISDVELKQRWRLYWIQCIFEFSHTKVQKMSWLQSPSEHKKGEDLFSSSFEECITSYFDTLNLYEGYAKAVEQSNVSKEEAENAAAFHMLAALYDPPEEDPEMILEDEEWIEVVEAAKGFWDYLRSNVTSERETALIKELEKEFSKPLS